MRVTTGKSAIVYAMEAIKQKIPEMAYKLDEPLRNHTTIKIGGCVYAMLFPGSIGILTEICSILSEYEITPFIMGNGSNILANDKRFDLIVIKTSNIKSISLIAAKVPAKQEYTDVTVEAGALLSDTAVFAYKNGLSGFEFAHGIPGTAGGAIVMNAGAYGREMKDVVQSTTVFNEAAGILELTAEDNELSYRQSRFSKTNEIVLSSVIRLEKENKEKIKQKIDDFDSRRKKSQPLDFPSCGSTFKRPENGYAAALIEQAGLKGYTIGGAQVSDKHAGFIINRKDASFDDVIKLIEYVQGVVLKRTGIQLEPEIRILH